MVSREDAIAELYRRNALNPQQKAAAEELARRGAITLDVAASQPEQPAEEPGMLDKIGNLFTGADRETRATRELPELEGILNGIDIPFAQKEKIALAGVTTTDPMELAKIIQSAAPDVIGIQTDEKGNVLLANNQTGARAVVNKPGFSQMDAVNLGALGAAFTPAGRVVKGAGAVGNAVAMGSRAAGTQFGIEGMQLAAGGDMNPGEIAMAGGFGAAAPMVGAGVSSALAKRGAGLADEAAKTVTQEQAQETVASTLGESIRGQTKRRTADLSRLASEVQPDETILQAAERLGMREALIPSQYSKNQAYREIEQGLASIPGSALNQRQVQATAMIAQKADEFIQQFGGSLDKAAFSDQFKQGALRTIDDLEQQSDQLYDALRSSIPVRTAVTPSSTIDFLTEQAKDLGGEQHLAPQLRKVLRDLNSGPTYGRLDMLRKQVGQALKGAGMFKDAETGQLKQLYARLLDDQAAVASELGQGEAFAAARSLVAQRKALEDNMVDLLGKDLSGALTRKLGGAVRNLGKGDFQQFDKIMAKIPADMRQAAVMTSMNDAFTDRARAQQQLSAPGFVDWYASLQRNQGAKERLFKYMPADSRKSLDDIYQVARGMREASKERITTGRIQALLDDFAQPGGMLSKLWDTGKGMAAAEGVSSSMGLTGAGAASVLAARMSKPSTPMIQAADALLASPDFKGAIAKVVREQGNLTNGAEVAEKVLTRTPAYKAWLKHASPGARRAIENVGFLMWITDPAREPSADTETEAPVLGDIR